MSDDLFDDDPRPRRKEERQTASAERKKLRALWRRMQYDYRSGKRSWDWAIPRIEARRHAR